MTIRAIFYDLDGTLRMNQPNGWQAFIEFANELGLSTTQEDYLRVARWEHYYFAQSSELIADRIAFPDGDSFWHNFGYRQLILLGASPQEAEDLSPKIFQLMNDRYRPADIVPNDLFETLQTLKERGFILGVFSNRSESFAEYLEEIGLSDFFSLAIDAGQAGVYKPNAGAFHFLLEKAGIPAQDAIYIGDNYFADVVGARGAGLTPVLLDVNGVFEKPDCPVIQSHNQIISLLDRRQ